MNEATGSASPSARGRIPWSATLIPGLPHLRRGRTGMGLSLLILALGMLSLLILGFERVRGAIAAGRPDEWIAVLTLFGAMIGAWGVGVREVGRTEAHRDSASAWAIGWGEFRKSRLAMLGLYLMFALYLATLLAPLLTPYDPNAIGDIAATRHLPPSPDHLLGTDRFGRDVLTRVLYGARISLSIGFIAVTISIALGTAVGAVSGYLGGVIDTLLMRFVDMLISFPRLVLLIVIIALFEPSLFLVVAALGLTLWPSTARIVRGEVLSLREREFIQAAQALGFGAPRIIFRHIVPNVLGPVIVAATLGLGNVILIEAGLSFLGLSVQPPTPTWGNMIESGREFLVQAWWATTFPGLAIVLTVVAFNLIGDGLRDAVDPRLRMRT